MRRGGLNAGYLFLLIMAFAWGLNWPVMKALMLEWPPFTARLLAGALAIVLLLLIAAGQRQPLLPRREQVPRLVAAGFLNVTAWSLFAPLSLFWLNASEAAIIAYTMPVWTTVFAWPVLGERPTWPRLTGLVLGLSGVILLLAGPLASVPVAEVTARLPGALFILMTALMFAGGAVFTKRYPIAMAPLPLVAWQIVVGLLPVIPVALSFETVDWSRITVLGWSCVVYLGVIAQVVAYLVWFQALKRLPAGTAAIGSLMVPIIGVVSAGWLLGEPLGLRQLASLGLTLGGVVLAARG